LTVHTNAQARGAVENRQRTDKEADRVIVKLCSRIVINTSQKTRRGQKLPMF